MDSQLLTYFVACCQTKSYAQAARKLFISRQALAQAIHKLEIKLGEPLFTCDNGELVLTPFGNYFLKSAQETLQAYQSMEESVNQWKTLSVNELRTAIGLGSLNAISPSLLTGFQAAHPEIKMTIQEILDQQVRERVASGEADLGIIGTVPDMIKEYRAYLIQSGQIYLQLSTDNPLSAKSSLEIEDVRHERFVSLGNECDMHRIFVNYCRQAGFEPNVTLITSDSNVANNLVVTNQAVSFGHIQTYSTVHSPAIRLLPLNLPNLNWGTFLFHKPEVELPGIAAMIHYFEQVSNAQQDSFSARSKRPAQKFFAPTA
jgi:DNA-binding transcriptional LysR family regulator